MSDLRTAPEESLEWALRGVKGIADARASSWAKAIVAARSSWTKFEDVGSVSGIANKTMDKLEAAGFYFSSRPLQPVDTNLPAERVIPAVCSDSDEDQQPESEPESSPS